MSNSQVLQLGSSSAPSPLHIEEVADVKELGKVSNTPDPCPLGCRVYIPQAHKMILQWLLDCANTNRVLLMLDILTWMDTENPDMCGFYRSSYSVTIGLHLFQRREDCFLPFTYPSHH